MKPKFIITIDTETFRVAGRHLPFGTHHYAELPEGSFGVKRIIDMCDKYGAKATFFVDVYMHRHYGEAEVAKLCQLIDGAGHDVQLHAHTSWFPGTHSGLIRDFPFDQQVEILAEGKQLIEKWTGKAPLGFRAGAYGANLDTIRALDANNFRIDSSYFPMHRNCELTRQLNESKVNKIFYINNILEIPVTTYWLFNSQSRKKNSKIDVNACSWAELRNVVPKFAESSVEYVILFLHSFSFIKLGGNGDSPAPMLKPLERFEALLNMVRNDLNGEFVTIGELSRMSNIEPDSAPDFVPSVSLLHMLPRVLNRLFD